MNPGHLTVDPQTARVFVFSQDNSTVCVLDAHTGALLSTTSLGRPVTFGIGGSDNTPTHTIDWSSGVKVTVDAVTDRLFVIHHYDTVLSVLDGRTGRVLRTVMLADMLN